MARDDTVRPISSELTLTMESLERLLGDLPKGLAIPLLVLFALIAAWPKIYEFITSLSPSEREKKKLELKKLRYEVEALETARGHEGPPRASPTKEEVNRPISPMSFAQRFSYGLIGGISLHALIILAVAAKGELSWDDSKWWEVLAFAIPLLGMEGLLPALVFGRWLAPSRTRCALGGAAVPLLVGLIGSALFD